MNKEEIEEKEDNKKKKYLLLLLLLLLLFLVFTCTYAFIKISFNINGRTKINKATWDVHFENLKVTEGSVKASRVSKIDSWKTNINYEVPLNIPGDYYEFTVDVVNKGSIPAKVSSSPTLGGITTEEDVYLNYFVTYSDGDEIKVNDELNSGDKVTYKVRVEFDKNIEITQLPKESEIFDLIFAINYVQK